MPTSAALDVVAQHLNLKFFEVILMEEILMVLVLLMCQIVSYFPRA